MQKMSIKVNEKERYKSQIENDMWTHEFKPKQMNLLKINDKQKNFDLLK